MNGLQRPTEPQSPLIARFVVADEVRSQFEQYRAQLPRGSMPVERVINPIRRRIRLVISNMELAAGAQQVEERLRKPAIISRQHADVPRPALLPVHRGEAVNRHYPK